MSRRNVARGWEILGVVRGWESVEEVLGSFEGAVGRNFWLARCSCAFHYSKLGLLHIA